MDKIIESSVINEDHKLSIDPARVRAMKPQTLDPSEEEVGMDEPSVDSGFGGSPKNLTIGKSRAGNLSKFLSPNYCGEDKGGDGASAKDSGFVPSSARSSFNKPKTKLEQSSAEPRTKSSCCIL